MKGAGGLAHAQVVKNRRYKWVSGPFLEIQFEPRFSD
jgi:hypothetical protein